MGLTRTIPLIVASALVCIPVSTHAAEFLFSEDNEQIVIDTARSEDVYAFGNIVSVESPIDADAFIFGQTITFAESVSQDIYTAGQTISLTGTVSDDAHIAANTVSIDGTVEGDVFAAGQTITIGEQSRIGEDLYLAAQSITIQGSVEGDVRVAGELVTVSSTAAINGNLIVYGEDPKIEDGAQIAGEVRVVQPKGFEEDRRGRTLLNSWVQGVASLFLIALALLYITPELTRRSFETYRSHAGQSLLTAIVWCALVVPVSIILLITVIGWPFAVSIPLFTVTVFILATGLTAISIGSWLMNRISSNRTRITSTDTESVQSQPSWSHALLGAVVYETVQLIGFVGWVITFIFVLIGFGALMLTLWDLVRNKLSSHSPSNNG